MGGLKSHPYGLRPHSAGTTSAWIPRVPGLRFVPRRRGGLRMSPHPTEGPALGTRVRVGRRLVWRFALPLVVVASMMTAGAADAAPPPAQPDFGPNVVIIDPSMSTSQIQSVVDAISTQ